MPNYAVTVQTTISATAGSRAARSTSFTGTETIEVQGHSIADALLTATLRVDSDTPPRIVSIEEVLEVDVASVTDERLAGALEQAPSPIALDQHDDEIIVDAPDYGSLVNDIATALSESGLMPGLTVSILRDENGCFDYAMVEIHDEGTHTYRSVGRDPRGLIENQALTGRAGILSVARMLMQIASSEHLL